MASTTQRNGIPGKRLRLLTSKKGGNNVADEGITIKKKRKLKISENTFHIEKIEINITRR